MDEDGGLFALAVNFALPPDVIGGGSADFLSADWPGELANARASGYVPTTEQAERGACGAKPILSRWLCGDAGRRMADAAQVMLHALWRD